MSETPSNPPARPVVGMYSFRSSDPQRLARFWAELMQLPLAEGLPPELAMLDLGHEHGAVTWMFERSDDPSSVPAPLGLDIAHPHGTDHHALADRAEALGAERVADRQEGGAVWVEMRDPDGNRFRVFGPRPT